LTGGHQLLKMHLALYDTVFAFLLGCSINIATLLPLFVAKISATVVGIFFVCVAGLLSMDEQRYHRVYLCHILVGLYFYVFCEGKSQVAVDFQLIYAQIYIYFDCKYDKLETKITNGGNVKISWIVRWIHN
jgi:hypothetical protein